MEYTRTNLRTWSMLGARGTFGTAIYNAAQEHDFVVFTADLGNSSGLDRYKAEYPARFINAGIAEQNMIGMAAGMAKDGTATFATSFAPFISLRAAEQIRMNASYMNLNLKLVGIGSGLSMAYLGNSHYGLEDCSIMRALPNMMVVSPADGAEIVKTVFAAVEHDGPIYIRLTGGPNNPIVYSTDYEFELGKAITLKNGNDVAIIAAGTMVYQSLKAAEELEKRGISTTVVNMHTIKPLDTKAIDALHNHRIIVTVEEHTIVGGLGSAVSEYLIQLRDRPPQMIIGINDLYPKAGSYSYLLEQCGLTAAQISQKIVAFGETM